MYQFVDQSLDSQEQGARFLVWAMRQWVQAAVQGRCACHMLCAAFTGVGVDEALDDFHIAMRTLCNNALAPLRFGAVERAEITEHEAILVATVLAGSDREEAAMRDIARQLVHADMAVLLARTLAGVGRRFAEAGLVGAARKGRGRLRP